MAQKVGEEGVEFALAAVSEDPEAAVEEAADLLFHLMVALQAQGLSLSDVIARLEKRHRTR
jgi:phosphoribosyl-ATP pyrophosphohydrolase/phosphoribosyl-AMP cyclohydrolase